VHAPTQLGETTLTFPLFVPLPAVLGGLLAGWMVYRLACRHLADTRRAKWFAVAAGLALAFGWYLMTFIAAAGAIGAIFVYFVVRAWLGARRALYAGLASYLGFTICVGGMLFVALDNMG
jgi:hypothetical protein